jgi:hypothetical protein
MISLKLYVCSECPFCEDCQTTTVRIQSTIGYVVKEEEKEVSLKCKFEDLYD